MSLSPELPFTFGEMLVLNVLLAVVLIVAAYTDATRGKIYNLLTFPAMLLGLLLNALLWGDGALTAAAMIQGLKWAGLGLLIGLGLLLVPFAFGGTKAGDVKMLMAVGAIKGWEFVLAGFLYGAVLFGVVALFVLKYKGSLRRTFSNIGEFFRGILLQTRPELSPPADDSKYPYGISLSIGFFGALALQYLVGRPTLWRW